VVFRSEDGALLEQRAFEDPASAEAWFLETEREHRDDSDVQVVMFSARSIENVMSTHPHYFKPRDQDPGSDTAEFRIVPAH